jgi:hypothetical protein
MILEPIGHGGLLLETPLDDRVVLIHRQLSFDPRFTPDTLAQVQKILPVGPQADVVKVAVEIPCELDVLKVTALVEFSAGRKQARVRELIDQGSA